jgi:hypothetical protein
MNILEQLESLEKILEEKQKMIEKDALFNTGGSTYGGLGFTSSTQVPWDPSAPWSTNRDTDNDGVVDALDYHFGAGV